MKKLLLKMTGVLLVAALLAGCGTGMAGTVPGSQKNDLKTGQDAQMFPVSSTDAPDLSGKSEERPDEPADMTESLLYENTAGSAAQAYIASESRTGYEDEECFQYGEPVSFNTEEYNAVRENGFHSVLTSPLSTFAADVDTASYANLRRMLEWGYSAEEIPSGAVRAEEIINYFNYNYAGPKDGEPFGINAQIAVCPWNPDNKLLVLGLQTREIDFSETPESNIVFLIDVSGSMDEPEKLPLLKEAFLMLAGQLGEKDRVSIVTYAGSDRIVLEGVHADQTERIAGALKELEANGSTNGGNGIITAYDLAERYYIEGGNNRVIIASDGDFNVGITSESELYDLISEEKEKGIFLSVLGFGQGNYSDARMETLADSGDGNYSYIDSVREAKKVLVEELGANMLTVAKDVKLQIEFNPAYVAQYRQIGYENRAMAAEDFSDDAKDGGEIGAGHSVTVLYELVPADPEETDGSSLKYQESDLTAAAGNSGEWLTLSVRYKEPDGSRSRVLEYPVTEECYTGEPSEDFRFAAVAAEFSMVLSGSDYIADGSLRHIKDVLDDVDLNDEYREEFADLVYMVR